jgi:hypothetical protein
LAGAKRIDLNGTEVDTVTEQDEHAATRQIDAINKKLNAYHRPPALPSFFTQQPTLIKQKVAPPMEKIDPVIRPELTRLYDAVLAANAAMSATADNKGMFVTITTAAIGMVVREAETVITTISGEAK